MNILALDIATKTGWATKSTSGVWDLKARRNESAGMRVIYFKRKLQEIIEVEKPDVIVYEMVAGRFKNAITVASEFVGVLKLFCEENDINYRSYSASEIKKYATGKGNANKEAMMLACEEKLGKVPLDDNHADALWLYDLASKDL